MDDKKVVVEQELKKGWEAATQLRSLIVPSHQTFNQRSSSSDHDDHQILINDDQTMDCMKNYSNTVLHSLENSISIIKSMIQSMEIQASSSTSSPNNRRYIIDTSNITPDGYTWRKYGQKWIQNTKHAREYFKCVYKEDQKCQATKHVQKISDTPTKYKITYYADHSCHPDPINNRYISNFNLVQENDCTNYISFELKNPISKQTLNHPIISLNSTPSFSLPSSKSLDHMSATTTMTTTTTMESSIVDIADVFSPTMSMSSGYVGSSDHTDISVWDYINNDVANSKSESYKTK
ncbi:unnamed protein product [Amaranthus hypochondriacus]